MSNLKEILSKHISKPGVPAFFFDVDGTLKDRDKRRQPDRFNPALPALLWNLQQLGLVGINTDQSASEFKAFKLKLDAKLEGESALTGPYYFEGGHTKVPINGSLDGNVQLLIKAEVQQEIESIFNIAVAAIIIEDSWVSIPNLPTELMLPSASEQALASKAIFEKGPNINDPSYRGEYELVRQWLTKMAKEAGVLQYCDIVEAGNGTLRIVQKGLNKGTPFISQNQEIPIENIVYTGDQINELPVVEIVKAHGGLVILPANAHPSLYPFADHISTLEDSDGVVEVFSQLRK